MHINNNREHESVIHQDVVKGNGFLRINKIDYPIKPGKAFFVPKNVEHCFFGNTKKLTVLYFFGGS